MEEDDFEWFLKHFKNNCSSVWVQFGLASVNEAIDEWRRYLTACVHGKGRHFERLL